MPTAGQIADGPPPAKRLRTTDVRVTTGGSFFVTDVEVAATAGRIADAAPLAERPQDACGAEVAAERSFSATDVEVAADIAGDPRLQGVRVFISEHVGQHEERWTAKRHYGFCGQSCPCCRAANKEDWPSGCKICVDSWYLAGASRAWAAAVKESRLIWRIDKSPRTEKRVAMVTAGVKACGSAITAKSILDADEEVQNALTSAKRKKGSASKVATGGKARGSGRASSSIRDADDISSSKSFGHESD